MCQGKGRQPRPGLTGIPPMTDPIPSWQHLASPHSFIHLSPSLFRLILERQGAESHVLLLLSARRFLKDPSASLDEIAQLSAYSPRQLRRALKSLVAQGLVLVEAARYTLAPLARGQNVTARAAPMAGDGQNVSGDGQNVTPQGQNVTGAALKTRRGSPVSASLKELELRIKKSSSEEDEEPKTSKEKDGDLERLRALLEGDPSWHRLAQHFRLNVPLEAYLHNLRPFVNSPAALRWALEATLQDVCKGGVRQPERLLLWKLRQIPPAPAENPPCLVQSGDEVVLPDGSRGFFAGWTQAGRAAFIEVEGTARLVRREWLEEALRRFVVTPAPSPEPHAHLSSLHRADMAPEEPPGEPS